MGTQKPRHFLEEKCLLTDFYNPEFIHQALLLCWALYEIATIAVTKTQLLGTFILIGSQSRINKGLYRCHLISAVEEVMETGSGKVG